MNKNLILVIHTLIFICGINSRDQQIYFPKKCSELNFLPMPKSVTCNIKNQKINTINSPCNIVYNIKTNGQTENKLQHIKNLIKDQQQKTFKCIQSHINFYQEQNKQNQAQYNVMVEIVEPSLRSAYTTKQQSYQLNINKNKAILTTNHYVGFVRGLQTFLQSITCNKKCSICYMLALPIEIDDIPEFQYRGLLVDTSRHFIPLNILKQTLDAMMYNKMNVFHWHIVDQDSFPLQLESHPQLAEFASFSQYETYSVNEVKDFIQYAMIRGIRVIPEIDTPGHASSWAKAPINAGVACVFGDRQKRPSKYKGPLDITLDKTYALMKQIFKQIFLLFPDPYVHLGGDEVQLTCLANKTDFIRLQNIKQQDMEIQYRRKQKKMLRQMNSSKTFIYWMYHNITAIDSDDVMHWWGRKQLVPNVTDRKLIISRSVGQFYIDMGTGNVWGTRYHDYSTWLNMHQVNFASQISRFPQKNNILGLEVTLWTETSNLYTHHLKIWIRSSAMAERAWTSSQYSSKPDFLRRLTAHERLMNRRGIPTAPATNQYCQYNPQFC